MKCSKCNSTKIRTRTNYTHGNKSKSTTSVMCKECGSTEMQAQQFNRRRKR